ncbi:MAG: extracellular solute-binding protein [Oscillospiraceae bacterium]|jgi:hypothetical protein|nr:extracellular solute-binding protein [Oscillospiraceae bacterium]
MEIRKFIAALLMLFLLAGCAPKSAPVDTRSGEAVSADSTHTPTQVQELTLAVVAEDGFVQPALLSAVTAFNAADADYRVNIVKYASVAELNTHITAGESADIFRVDGLPFESFANKGLFEDLNPYFDADPKMDLVPAFRKAMSTGEQLYKISPSFHAWTLTGLSDVVGDAQGWTFDELEQIIADNSATVTDVIAQQWDKEAALTFLLYQNLDEYIDWENGKALFNTEDFKNLLEFINTFPKSTTGNADWFEQLRTGKSIVIFSALGAVEGFTNFDSIMGGEIVAKGFPSVRKSSGVLASANFELACSATSANPKGAFAFIKSALETNADAYSMPFLKSQFDAAINTAMTEPTLLKEPMTNAQYEKFMKFLEGIDTLSGMSQPIQAIIHEETASYFAGQKDVEEVCRIIQSRTNLYIGEQG